MSGRRPEPINFGQRSLSDYRVYLCNEKGYYLEPPFHIMAADDQDAVERLEPLFDGRNVEVWQGERLVAQFLCLMSSRVAQELARLRPSSFDKGDASRPYRSRR